MEMWFSDISTPNIKLNIRVKKQLFSERSDIQQVDVFDSEDLGRFITLDGEIVFSEKDEFIYDEMVAHVPMAVHPNVKKVLVIGGGDGGVAKELCRYPEIERIDVVEEDEMFVYVSKKFFPETAEGLADCALATAKSAMEIAGIAPRIAMLSFSSKGSAKHDNVTLVQEATRIAKEKSPNLAIDGELQFDAAIVPEVAAIKAPGSEVAGRANVLVFPDLQAGNIGYKIAERLGGFQAIGPICQGFAKPLNDLSRGCKACDIVCAVAITALQVKD